MPDALRFDRADSSVQTSTFPSEFGRFTLRELLGQGGMGAVFSAEMRGPGGFSKRIALKVLHPSVIVATRRMGIDLRTEARLGALLHHPGIVEIYDYGVYAGQPWISMELVDGVELSDLLRGAGMMPASALMELSVQLAEALDHAHCTVVDGRAAGFVHRDLKPSNVIIDATGRVKITDFGIAKASIVSHVTTRAGVTKGTPAYMSPEQARGGDVDARSDLFSLGAMLYQVATGRRLFRGGSPAATVLEVLHVDEILADRSILREVDERVPGFGFVLRGCLQEDADLRWGSADELLEALSTIELNTPPGPTLRCWIEDLPDCGRIYRGIRSVRGRSPVPVPRAPLDRALLPPDEVSQLVTTTEVRGLQVARRLPAGALMAVLFGFGLGLGVSLGQLLAPTAPPADDRAWRAVVGAEAVAAARAPEAPADPPLVLSAADPSPVTDEPSQATGASELPSAVILPARLLQILPASVPEPAELAATRSPPTTAVHPAARDASMPQPVELATVGESRSFVLEAPAADVLGVELYIGQGQGVWRRETLARYGGGRWGLKVPITERMEGELPYYYELLRRGGRTELHGRPEAPFIATVTAD